MSYCGSHLGYPHFPLADVFYLGGGWWRGGGSFCIWLNMVMSVFPCTFCCFFTQSYLKDQWEAWRNIPWNSILRTNPRQCHTCLHRASAYSSYHCNAGLEPTQKKCRLKNNEMLYTLHEIWGFFHYSVVIENPSPLGCDNVLCCFTPPNI